MALDRLRGDDWDHTAVDPESRLLLALVPGKRNGATCARLIRQVRDRTGGRLDLLITSDEPAPYETSIHEVYGVEQPRPKRLGPGRPPKPVKVAPPDLCYATVWKRRGKGRVVEVVRTLVFGMLRLLDALLRRSTASTTINTSFVERNNGTDRHQNPRKRRKTYAFSKDLTMHRAASYFVGYSYNFCWTVRTLRVRDPDGAWQARTPAMAAGLSDHVMEYRGVDYLPRKTALAIFRHHPAAGRGGKPRRSPCHRCARCSRGCCGVPAPSPERIAAEVTRVLWRKEAARIYRWHKATGTFPPRRPRPDTS